MGSFPSSNKKYKIFPVSTKRYRSIFVIPEAGNVLSAQICLIQSSWIEIKEGSARGIPPCKNGETALTFFYEQFYSRLFNYSSKFKQIFHGIKVKAAILCRIISFLCSIQTSNLRETRIQLSELGKRHNKYNILPWMHSALNTSLVETVRMCLGKRSVEICDAWEVALCFASRHMLRQSFKYIIINDNRHKRYLDEAELPQIQFIELQGVS